MLWDSGGEKNQLWSSEYFSSEKVLFVFTALVIAHLVIRWGFNEAINLVFGIKQAYLFYDFMTLGNSFLSELQFPIHELKLG